MKKTLRFALIGAGIVLFAAGVLVGVYCLAVPSGKTVVQAYAQAYVLNRGTWKLATMEPGHKTIQASRPKDGMVLPGFGYTVVLDAKLGPVKKAQSTIMNQAASRKYTLPKYRSMVLDEQSDYARMKEFMQEQLQPVFTRYGRQKVEAAVGCPIASVYDHLLAMYSVTVHDFTTFDDDKNEIISGFLKMRTYYNQDTSNIKEVYFFDTEATEGFVTKSYAETNQYAPEELLDQLADGKNPNRHGLVIFAKDDPDTVYRMELLGFTDQEAQAIAGSFAFDEASGKTP